MRHRIHSLIPLNLAAGFALLAAVMLSACAATNPEVTRTKSLLAAAGFHTVKPETPEQSAIFSQMPAYALEGGIIQGKQLYSYKDLSKGTVYVGGETEFQQYEVLLAKWKKLNESTHVQNTNLHRNTLGDQAFGNRDLWLNQDMNQY
jgi:hypothetical protein